MLALLLYFLLAMMLCLAPSLPPYPQLIPGLTCCLSVMQNSGPEGAMDSSQAGSSAADLLC